MSAALKPDEIVRALQAQGVPREKAELYAMGGAVRLSLTPPSVVVALTFPFRLTLPWSALCSDNYREEASLTVRGGKTFPRKVMSARYKAAREKTRALAKEIVGDAVAVAQPLAIHARVFVPDEHPHDVCNFAKVCHDALEGIVYRNDRWLYRTLWERVGVDVDAPRAEIEITLR